MFFDFGDDNVIWVNHFVEVNFGYFREEFVGVHFREAVAGMHPVNQLGEGDAKGVIERPIDADRHDVIVVLEAGPIDFLVLDEVHLKLDLHGDFDGSAIDFAIAHGSVAIAKGEQRSGDAYGKIESVADAGLRRVHVSTEFGGNDRTAGFPAPWRNANAA